jgi:hypothetical protein
MNIQPITIWKNGEAKTATQISITIISDNLTDSATFYYRLLTEESEQVAEGNVGISGEDYANWFSNEDAYTYVTDKLNLVLSE